MSNDDPSDEDPSAVDAWRELADAVALVARTVVNLHPAQLAFAPLQAARTMLLAHVPAASSALTADRPAKWTHRLLALGERSIDSEHVGLGQELERAERALDGRLVLLGKTFDFSSQERRLEPSRSARTYRLEWAALDVVRSLAIASRTSGFAKANEAAVLASTHLTEVLEQTPSGSEEGWEPQVVTARLFNLFVARELLDGVLDEDALAVEMARHARWLFATLEWQLPSTRRAGQAAALFVASCLLETPGASAWRKLGSMLLARAAHHDVFADGGHVTRSSTLAAQHLQRLLIVLAAARRAGCAAPDGVEAAADRLARHLLAVSHPGGLPPAWRDSSDDGAPCPVDLAGALGLTSGTLHESLLGRVANVAPLWQRACSRFDDAGVVSVTEGGSHLVVFCAPPGSADAARHAHSDVGSFEFSQDGVVLVREPGAGTFEAGAWRDYVRSPAAHSTISVNGRGPDELWGGFLVGSRGRREPIEYQAFSGGHVVRTSVTSFAGWRHDRLMVLLPGHLLAVFDRVVDADPDATVFSHVHLPPKTRLRLNDVEGVVESGGRSWLVNRVLGDGWTTHKGEREPPHGWSAPSLGSFKPSPVLSVTASQKGNSFLAAWALELSPEGRIRSAPQGMFELCGKVTVRVRADARGLRWHRPD